MNPDTARFIASSTRPVWRLHLMRLTGYGYTAKHTYTLDSLEGQPAAPLLWNVPENQ